eukprot:scaffold1410_cov76-Skeletonema_dohrnii-CCMP3373.AAC.4
MSGSDNDEFLTNNICAVCNKEDCGSLCPNISGVIAQHAVNVMGGNSFDGLSGADRLKAINDRLTSSLRYHQLCKADCSLSISGLGEVSTGVTQDRDDDIGDEADGNEIVDDITAKLAILFEEHGNDDDIVERIRDTHLTALENGQFEAALTDTQRAVLVLDFIRILYRRFKKMERDEAVEKIRRALTHYTIGIEIPMGIENSFDLFVGKKQGLEKERNTFAGFGDVWAQAFDQCTGNEVITYPLVGDTDHSQDNASNESGDGSNDGSDDGSDDDSDDSSYGGSDNSSDCTLAFDDESDDDDDDDDEDILAFLLSSSAHVSKEGESKEDTEVMVDTTNDNSSGQSRRKRKANA